MVIKESAIMKHEYAINKANAPKFNDIRANVLITSILHLHRVTAFVFLRRGPRGSARSTVD